MTPIGALVDEDASDFSTLLFKRLETPNPRVVVCMHEVPYMDSMALEGLLDATEALADRASALKLLDVTQTCREILELTGLSGRFRFFSEVQDAVKSYL